MFVVCWSSQQIKYYIRKRVSKQTDFCQQFACGFNLFADIMQTMSQAMSQCVQKYVQFFGDRITEPLFSGSLFAIHRNKHWHNVCFIYTFISFGQLRVSKSRNKKLRRGTRTLRSRSSGLSDTMISATVLVLGTASPHIRCDKSQNSLTMTLSTLSYWNFLFYSQAMATFPTLRYISSVKS